MKKAIWRTVTVLLIISAALACGYFYTRICDKLDRRNYPLEYSETVDRYANEYGVPRYIIYSVIKVESDFKSNAVSVAGAVGLMQITSDTFDWIKMKLGESGDYGLMYDPETNIRYGTFLLSYLQSEFGNWDTAFAAYNAGIGNVRKWLEDSTLTDANGNLIKIPFTETRNYLERVNRARDTYGRLYGTGE